MSYDISLCDPVTHKPLKADSTHFIAGNMRAMGGTKELWLNVTYNYGHFYYRPEVFGDGGIRSIYGKTGAESIPMLEKAISALGDDVDDSDYWNATEGNVLHQLNILQMLSDSPKRSAVTSSRSTTDLYTVKVQSYMKFSNEL